MIDLDNLPLYEYATLCAALDIRADTNTGAAIYGMYKHTNYLFTDEQLDEVITEKNYDPLDIPFEYRDMKLKEIPCRVELVDGVLEIRGIA